MSDRAAPPGAHPLPDDVAQRVRAALLQRREGTPRTRHRDGSQPHFSNRLALESSPYLLQHAHNPVNWYPWGDEAFEAARTQQKPVFLSIGYATCHWCHVMEEESFEDLEIARLLNERYIAVKVDREERPDVDAVYMTAVQSVTGQGGWPMSVWLDADRRPFFAGTYFPPHDGDRGAARGFASILAILADAYRDDSQRIGEAAGSIVAAVQRALTGPPPGDAAPSREAIDKAVSYYQRAYDSVDGGLRGAPKFPSSLPVRLLLRHHRYTGDAASLDMAVHTLEAMAAGGMHDQIGGGFHRYSTDARWIVPHFEKMLYDNALLALAYAEAWQVTHRPDFARVLRTTLDYVLRELTSPEGGFYSATDADSEGEEGIFFVWRLAQIRTELGDRTERFARFYGVTERGNFEGANVLHVPRPDEETWESFASERATLFSVRERREHPLLDDKILTAWNGLMISALALGARVTGESRYTQAAEKAAAFVLTRLRREGRLQRSGRGEQTSGPGFLEDDAFVTAALLDLYELTFDERHLRDALDIAERTERLFAAPDGGWYRSATDGEALFARERPRHDGAEPSGASVAVLNALRLSAMTGDDRWRAVAQGALRAYEPTLRDHPWILHDMLLALDFATSDPREVLFVWPSGEAAPPAFAEVLRRRFVPNRVVLGAAEGVHIEALRKLSAIARDKVAVDGVATAYVCRNGACDLPVQTAADLSAHLQAAGSAGYGKSTIV